MASSIVLLAANTTRSSAYATMLAEHEVDLVVLRYGHELPGRPGRGSPPGSIVVDGVEVDPGRPLDEIVAEAGWEEHELPHADLKSPELRRRLAELSPELVVFSGYGGEIVGGELLALAPFLHVHAGRLPGYRGSTTPYYMLLDGEDVEVTAILLTAKLDAGTIVGRRSFPAPAAGTDVDHVFDPAARAALIREVVAHYLDDGSWPVEQPQGAVSDRPYHVIHPVLKHVALLSLREEGE